MINNKKALREYLKQYLDSEHIEEIEDIIANAVKIFKAREVVINDHTGNSITVNTDYFDTKINEGGCNG